MEIVVTNLAKFLLINVFLISTSFQITPGTKYETKQDTLRYIVGWCIPNYTVKRIVSFILNLQNIAINIEQVNLYFLCKI